MSDSFALLNAIKIVTDEPSMDAPDFKSYARQLSRIIFNSTPRFTVGIYGGWGTGKTTLMQMIRNELDKNYYKNVVTIWFDSWRYYFVIFIDKIIKGFFNIFTSYVILVM